MANALVPTAGLPANTPLTLLDVDEGRRQQQVFPNLDGSGAPSATFTSTQTVYAPEGSYLVEYPVGANGRQQAGPIDVFAPTTRVPATQSNTGGGGGGSATSVKIDGVLVPTLDLDSTPASAAQIAFAPVGTISSTDVQSALAEVAAEATAGGGTSSYIFDGGAPDSTYSGPDFFDGGTP